MDVQVPYCTLEMGDMDESFLSTASTLIGSCSASASASASVDDNAKENEVTPVVDLWKGANVAPAPAPATSINIDIDIDIDRLNSTKPSVRRFLSPATTATTATTNTTTTTATETSTTTSTSNNNGTTTSASPFSKLDRLRARTKLLRKQGSQKIAEGRASLRINRTISILSTSPSPSVIVVDNNYGDHQVQVVGRGTKRASTTTRTTTPITGSKVGVKSDLPFLLRRSNSAIDRLSAEIAAAGSIMMNNNSYGDDNNNNNNNNNDVKIKFMKDHDDNSIHGISVGDWDESTISVTPPSSMSSASAPVSPPKIPPPPLSTSSSGLPPPEVVVKTTTRTAAVAIAAAATRTATALYSSTSTAELLHNKGRHQRQRPPSISPSRGDCASMYNTNQQCEKLKIENDCLKRQLDLLESRHRDWQRKQSQWQHQHDGSSSHSSTTTTTTTADNEDQHQHQQRRRGRRRGGHKSSITGKTTIGSNSFGRRRKRKKGARRRIAMVLLVAPLLIASTLWFYRSVRNASSPAQNTTSSSLSSDVTGSASSLLLKNNGSATTTIIRTPLNDLALMMRHGVLRQTLFRDNSSDINNEIIDDIVNDEENDFNTIDDSIINDGGISGDINEYSNEDNDVDHIGIDIDINDLPDVIEHHFPVLHEAPPKYQDYNSNEHGSNIGSKIDRFKRILPRIRIREDHNPTGVWLKLLRKITTKKSHAEL